MESKPKKKTYPSDSLEKISVIEPYYRKSADRCWRKLRLKKDLLQKHSKGTT